MNAFALPAFIIIAAPLFLIFIPILFWQSITGADLVIDFVNRPATTVSASKTIRVTSSPSPDFIPAFTVANLTPGIGYIFGKFFGANGETFKITDMT